MKAIQRVIKGISKKVFWFRYRHYDREKKIKLLNKVCYHVGERTDVFAESLGSEPYLISIGDDTIIASDVSFVTHDASVYNAYRYLGKHDFSGVEKKGPIIVGNNCFVGRRSLLLPGTVIGDNSIIAAGSVVNGQIPPNEVWGGYRHIL